MHPNQATQFIVVDDIGKIVSQILQTLPAYVGHTLDIAGDERPDTQIVGQLRNILSEISASMISFSQKNGHRKNVKARYHVRCCSRGKTLHERQPRKRPPPCIYSEPACTSTQIRPVSISPYAASSVSVRAPARLRSKENSDDSFS